jgi:SRSO17 transposase
MKKIILLLTPIILLSQSFMISNIPLPKTYIQNLDPYECNEECLNNFIDQGMIFSFLAHTQDKKISKELQDTRNMYLSILNLGSYNSQKMIKFALLIPYKKIGRYASSTTNATFSYLITKGDPFILKSYKIKTENLDELNTTLQTIKQDGFKHIIAPLTLKGAKNTISLNPTSDIYFPTINKQDVNTSLKNIYFGAIDYKAQSDLLLKQAVSPLIIFSDKSSTGKKLSLYQQHTFLSQSYDTNNSEFEDKLIEKKVIPYYISKRTTNLERYLKENDNITHGSFFINTPIIKSGMVLSQLTLYDTNATNVLSTQINYNPLLLSMTQYVDRKDMLIANSITKQDNIITETNSLLGNDIVYDWINYTTTIGVDYFYSKITSEAKVYNIDMQENQMIYDIELLKPARYRFKKLYLD